MQKTELLMDKDLRAVVEFMQDSIPACKLVGLSETLPQLARLLWGHFQQEPVKPLELLLTKTHPSQSNANGCDPAKACVGGGSAVAADVQ